MVLGGGRGYERLWRRHHSPNIGAVTDGDGLFSKEDPGVLEAKPPLPILLLPVEGQTVVECRQVA